MPQINERETRCVPSKTNRVKQECERINRVLGTIKTQEIGETNDLILAWATVLTERLGLKRRNEESSGNKEINKDRARQRTEKEIERCRKNLGLGLGRLKGAGQ